MKKVRNQYYLCVSIFLFLISCSVKNSEIGKWQRIGGGGFIEFTNNSEFILTDNMNATAAGTYEKDKHGNIIFKINETDIFRDSIEKLEKPEVIKAKIRINNDELEIIYVFEQGNETEKYKRIK